MTGEPTVLIVDDDVKASRGLASLLMCAGYTVHTAYCASDGLDLARSNQLDAIILDYHVPLMRGAAFLYRFRQLPDHQHTPVLLVTGVAISAEQATELADLQAVVMSKPLEPSQFLAEVGQLVHARCRPRPEIGKNDPARAV
jgi:CheY-like chemotaxis protein